MATTILKSIFIGALMGTMIFFAPGFIIGLAITFLIFRLMIGRKMRGGRYGEYRLAFADKVRSMSDEEYEQFKSNIHNQDRRCC
ncbi:MAG: hypothetical protein A3D31_04355 [Candidatus Fluviicola riflensis]|nr:MAG: hypothetical protein CHH17_10670 [Candidatus Fluviicola riflensis]OGS79208.1 MAG: hypothetical protein A3D31_04355 [Candidatus Fluviicola riflensis]OGS86640.1 MAG: hypothetical protein A2724_03815 [Fluviicola sp. RIFCSPHIGHO2_01_FULL_43_53]OGS88886.1 MAG: hypothetical protein A3E30_00845 [Fluviicola sp. RIFCSPHIGHO2_12_FULL_43_24]